MSYQANCQLCSWTGPVSAAPDAGLFEHEASEQHVRELARVITVQHDPTDRGADRISCALCGVITERLVGGARQRLLAHENGPQHQERYAALVGVAEVEQEPEDAPEGADEEDLADQPVAPAPVYDQLRDATRERVRPDSPPVSAARSQSDQSADNGRFDRRALFVVAGLAVAFAGVVLFLATRDGAPAAAEYARGWPTAAATPAHVSTELSPEWAAVFASVTATPPATATPTSAAAALAIVSTPSPTPSATPSATATPAPLRVTVSSGLGELPRLSGGQMVDGYVDITLSYKDGLPVVDAWVHGEPEGSEARTDRWGRVIVPVRTIGTHDLTVQTPLGAQVVRVWAPQPTTPSWIGASTTATLAVGAPAGTVKPTSLLPCVVDIPGGRFWRESTSSVVRVVAAPDTLVEVTPLASTPAPTGTTCGSPNVDLYAYPPIVRVGENGQGWLRGLRPGSYLVRLFTLAVDGRAPVVVLSSGTGVLTIASANDTWTVTGR